MMDEQSRQESARLLLERAQHSIANTRAWALVGIVLIVVLAGVLGKLQQIPVRAPGAAGGYVSSLE